MRVPMPMNPSRRRLHRQSFTRFTPFYEAASFGIAPRDAQVFPEIVTIHTCISVGLSRLPKRVLLGSGGVNVEMPCWTVGPHVLAKQRRGSYRSDVLLRFNTEELVSHKMFVDISTAACLRNPFDASSISV